MNNNIHHLPFLFRLKPVSYYLEGAGEPYSRCKQACAEFLEWRTLPSRLTSAMTTALWPEALRGAFFHIFKTQYAYSLSTLTLERAVNTLMLATIVALTFYTAVPLSLAFDTCIEGFDALLYQSEPITTEVFFGKFYEMCLYIGQVAILAAVNNFFTWMLSFRTAYVTRIELLNQWIDSGACYLGSYIQEDGNSLKNLNFDNLFGEKISQYATIPHELLGGYFEICLSCLQAATILYGFCEIQVPVFGVSIPVVPIVITIYVSLYCVCVGRLSKIVEQLQRERQEFFNKAARQGSYIANNALNLILGGRLQYMKRSMLNQVEEIANSIKKQIYYKFIMAIFNRINYWSSFIIGFGLGGILVIGGLLERSKIWTLGRKTGALIAWLTWQRSNAHEIEALHLAENQVNALRLLIEKSAALKQAVEDNVRIRRKNNVPIELSGIAYRANTNEVLFEIDDSIKIPQGRTVYLRGKSGVGKSTLLRLLAGIYPYAEMELTLPKKPDCLILPQEVLILPNYTLIENLLGHQMDGGSLNKEQIDSIKDLMCHLEFAPSTCDNLDNPAMTDWSSLSGGEKQRLALLSALAPVAIGEKAPELFVFDEMTSAFDETLVTKVLRLVKKTLPETTIIYTTHKPILGEADFYDAQLVIENGSLRYEQK